MELQIQGSWEFPHFDRIFLRVEGYILLGLCLLLVLSLFYLRRRDFRSLRGRALGQYALLLLLTILFNNVLWLRFSTSRVLPRPGIPAPPPVPSFPLLGMGPVFVIAALFGAGPALVGGALAGLVRGGMHDMGLFAPVELALVGATLGFLLHQAYRGREWQAMRQPIGAATAGALGYWVLHWVGTFATTPGNSLSAFDFTRSFLFASAAAIALDLVIGGLLTQALYGLIPSLKPRSSPHITPPHLRSMNRRLLAALVPLTLLMILSMFYAVTTAAINEATRQVINSMSRGGNQAAQMIPYFFNTGQELLDRFARTEQLTDPDPAVRQQTLSTGLQVGIYGPFFNQFLITDRDGRVTDVYPTQDLPPTILPQETQLLSRTLQFGAPQHSSVFAAQDQHLLSFIVPIRRDGVTQAALIGRTLLNTNPTVNQILAALQELEEVGFIIDEQSRVVFHPDPAMLLTEWELNPRCNQVISTPPPGQACKDLAPLGTQRLVYHRPVAAMTGWTVVVTHPYEDVLDRATRISGPLLLILLIVTIVLAIVVPGVTSRLTRPLQALATAAHNIAAGELDAQVVVTGDDEVGRLGNAFERMRLSLKDRLDDLSLLLRVSQAVSSSLDISQGLPIILDGALQTTNAHGARLILLNERGTPRTVVSHDGDNRITPLDRALAQLVREGRPVLIENTARSRSLIEPQLIDADTRALIAVPMRSKAHLVGVLWLSYQSPHVFATTEVDFLSTLASQAAVAVENARLFQAAEGGRRRLAAILESTNDLIIVTDHKNRVLLLNPAAADVFGVDARTVSGKPITQAIQEETVVRLLTVPMDGGVPLTAEVPLPDGRTFSASASAIFSGDGKTIGRVAVLRDITYLKELDDLKSEFVSTVSHDLRAPLTFMRGYATMIPMVGEVTPKQKLYVDKIMAGIEQMTELIEDLLDLGRIEAGVGLVREPCRLDEIIMSLVDSMRPQAKAHGVTLRLDRTEDVTLVVGDAALLRRIVSNLVDNAIKYTPSGGKVSVGWETRGDRVLMWVSDTGIGIAKKDQVRLFEKFSRIKRRETINIKGSGLGLAIVKSIVERHNGRVWVESELHKGSTFFVELPTGQAQ